VARALALRDTVLLSGLAASHEIVGQGRTLVDQDKGDLEIDAVLRNLAVFHDDLLFFNPRALDVLECFDRTLYAFLDRILEAFFGARDNLRYSGYRHGFLLGGLSRAAASCGSSCPNWSRQTETLWLG
jgi:hypothetical protein